MAKSCINPKAQEAPALEDTSLKRAMTDTEAGCYIGMSRSWLRHMRINGAGLNHLEGPRFIKMGRSVRYLREDVDEWLERFQRFEHLAQYYTGSQGS